MILERVEIVGFRGINRLSLMLEQNNVLIGENAWGKSSLLDALTLLLSPESDLYHFDRDDFGFRREMLVGGNIICKSSLLFVNHYRDGIVCAVISHWLSVGRHVVMAITGFSIALKGKATMMVA